jgi:hypothetical protein
MNAAQILDLAGKAIALIETVRTAAAPALAAVSDLIARHKSGEPVTEADLERVQAMLDAQLDSFNQPLPPE